MNCLVKNMMCYLELVYKKEVVEDCETTTPDILEVDSFSTTNEAIVAWYTTLARSRYTVASEPVLAVFF